MMEKVSKNFFFEKKKQKTSANWATGVETASVTRPKVFCFFFSKKKRFLPLKRST